MNKLQKTSANSLPVLTVPELNEANAALGPQHARSAGTATTMYGLGAIGTGALALALAQQIKARKKLSDKDLFKQSDSSGPLPWFLDKATNALSGTGSGGGSSLGDYLLPAVPLAAVSMATPSIVQAIRDAYPADTAKDRLNRVKKKYDKFISERLMPKTASETPMFHGLVDAITESHEKRAFISWPTFWGLAALAGTLGFARQSKYEQEYSPDVIKGQAANDAIKRWRLEQPHRLRVVNKKEHTGDDAVDAVDENTVAIDLPKPKELPALPEKLATVELKGMYDLCKAANIDFEGLYFIVSKLTPAQKSAALQHGITIQLARNSMSKQSSAESYRQAVIAGLNSSDPAIQQKTLADLNAAITNPKLKLLGIGDLLPKQPLDLAGARQLTGSPTFQAITDKVYPHAQEMMDSYTPGVSAPGTGAPESSHAGSGMPEMFNFSGKQLGFGAALGLIGALGLGSGNTGTGIASFLAAAAVMFGPQILRHLGVESPILDWMDNKGKVNTPNTPNTGAGGSSAGGGATGDTSDIPDIEADQARLRMQAESKAQQERNNRALNAVPPKGPGSKGYVEPTPVPVQENGGTPPPVNPEGAKPPVTQVPGVPAQHPQSQPLQPAPAPAQQAPQPAQQPQMPPPTQSRPTSPAPQQPAAPAPMAAGNPLEKKPLDVTQAKPVSPNPAKIAADLIKRANLMPAPATMPKPPTPPYGPVKFDVTSTKVMSDNKIQPPTSVLAVKG